ncbi:leucine-rich repeat domain protein [Rhodopirellula maiorica SM1]|uniref:Leucine-rich repeat domain protein n=1 Tax=Rhodopirellula maiorica SM1 TaxID=1265738 RepID=M5R7N8_9BACT|nr:leucine-rich repeat domain protein [Rhodopirellula maiorica SM1]
MADESMMHRIARLRHLIMLNCLGDSVTDDVLASLAQCDSLCDLKLQSCVKVTESGIEELSRTENLHALTFFKTNVYPSWLIHIAEMKQLRNLNIYGPKLIDEDLDFLESLPKLDQFSLEAAKITDNGVATIANLKAIEKVGLTNCSGVTQNALVFIADNPRISEFQTEGIPLTNDGLKHLENSRLQYLRLARANLTDDCVESIKKMKQLTRIGIVFSTLSGSRLEELSEIPNLQWLELSFTDVGDNALQQIAEIQSLKCLTIVETPATISAVDNLKQKRPDLKVHYSGRN